MVVWAEWWWRRRTSAQLHRRGAAERGSLVWRCARPIVDDRPSSDQEPNWAVGHLSLRYARRADMGNRRWVRKSRAARPWLQRHGRVGSTVLGRRERRGHTTLSGAPGQNWRPDTHSCGLLAFADGPRGPRRLRVACSSRSSSGARSSGRIDGSSHHIGIEFHYRSRGDLGHARKARPASRRCWLTCSA